MSHASTLRLPPAKKSANSRERVDPNALGGYMRVPAIVTARGGRPRRVCQSLGRAGRSWLRTSTTELGLGVLTSLCSVVPAVNCAITLYESVALKVMSATSSGTRRVLGTHEMVVGRKKDEAVEGSLPASPALQTIFPAAQLPSASSSTSMLEDATRAALLAIRQGGEWHFHMGRTPYPSNRHYLYRGSGRHWRTEPPADRRAANDEERGSVETASYKSAEEDGGIFSNPKTTTTPTNYKASYNDQIK
ncbi:hypothetical protein AB1N83_013771 [Pleurotus pulmonarius]